jgi:hypothetical protein
MHDGEGPGHLAGVGVPDANKKDVLFHQGIKIATHFAGIA